MARSIELDNTAMTSLQDIGFSFSPIDNAGGLKAEWCSLADRSDNSFFQSWHWIGTWLATLPSNIKPMIARLESGNETIALGILVSSRARRHVLWRPRTLLLHQTGIPESDSIFIEHNGWLVDRRHADRIIAVGLDRLATSAPDCDEFVFGGVDDRYLKLARSTGDTLITVKSLPSFSLDLRSEGIADLSRFGRNTRHQIRRTLRDYGTLGRIELRAASDPDEAEEFLTELKTFHQAYWARRGRQGAFAHPYFERFHRALIASAWPSGQVELLRIGLGRRAVGLLYNFRYRGRLYAYQSGFDYDFLTHGRPGLLSHWLAIERHLASGTLVYDFLAGDNQLKRSLSSTATALHWIIIQRDRPALRCERLAMRLVRRLRGPGTTVQAEA